MGYYGLGLMFDPTIWILIPGVILSFIAQMMVQNAYSRYSRVQTRSGITGEQAARAIMRSNGLNVPIQLTGGELTDNYNPINKTMNLSGPVASRATVASVGVAAHEAGHALQDAAGYIPLKIRNFLVPICNFASAASWPLFLIGLLFSARTPWGTTLMDIGILLFIGALTVYVITLPVEFNASRRAVKALREQELIADDEVAGVKKVLRAAALTYVASMFMALLQLIRLLAIRGNRN